MLRALAILTFIFAASFAHAKSDYSCKYYTSQMAKYRKSGIGDPEKSPRQIQLLFGIIYGSFLARSEMDRIKDTDPSIEPFLQRIFEGCENEPKTDAVTMIMRTAKDVEHGGAMVARTKTRSDWMEVSIETLKKEKSIVDALFSNGSSRSLWVSMRDDGSDRSGYAEFVCIVLHESGMPPGQETVIRIWDAAAMAREEMREMGNTICTKSE